jgi:hypothetical protein
MDVGKPRAQVLRTSIDSADQDIVFDRVCDSEILT